MLTLQKLSAKYLPIAVHSAVLLVLVFGQSLHIHEHPHSASHDHPATHDDHPSIQCETAQQAEDAESHRRCVHTHSHGPHSHHGVSGDHRSSAIVQKDCSTPTNHSHDHAPADPGHQHHNCSICIVLSQAVHLAKIVAAPQIEQTLCERCLLHNETTCRWSVEVPSARGPPPLSGCFA